MRMAISVQQCGTAVELFCEEQKLLDGNGISIPIRHVPTIARNLGVVDMNRRVPLEIFLRDGSSRIF
jgi:hypothetical protein